jgi:GT2 family glycosyltransferase
MRPNQSLHDLLRRWWRLLAPFVIRLAGRVRRRVAQLLPRSWKDDLRRGWRAVLRWRRRAARLIEAVCSLHPRVAIVIVVYTDVARLRMCLESVFSKTNYPNYEVVVVDNSGAMSVRELLSEQARQRPNLKLVFNERNLGFPRAVNVGIEAAGACHYLALLNDDTVVTRGWLGRLLRHLETPGIELVGPVTNWAGNEARIEVDYETVDEMEEFATTYTRRYENVAWDIPMLALYCAVMRRELLDRLGWLDERFGIGMFEDDDFSRRVREAGGRVVCAEDVFIHHWGRSSFGVMEEGAYRRLFDENRAKFEEKWGEPWRPHSARLEGGGIPRSAASIAAARPSTR